MEFKGTAQTGSSSRISQELTKNRRLNKKRIAFAELLKVFSKLKMHYPFPIDGIRCQDDKQMARLAIKTACKKAQMIRDRVVALIEKKYAGKGKANWKKKSIERKTERMKKVLLDWKRWC